MEGIIILPIIFVLLKWHEIAIFDFRAKNILHFPMQSKKSPLLRNSILPESAAGQKNLWGPPMTAAPKGGYAASALWSLSRAALTIWLARWGEMP